jgi:hypothetical protein
MGRGILSAAGAFGLALTATAASAASYNDLVTADPTSFVCNTFGNSEVCGSAQIIQGVTLNAGDTIDMTVNYTSPVHVPGSPTQNLLFITLFDPLVTEPASPGPDAATVDSSVTGYVGPANPVAHFSGSFLHQYIGIYGFGGGPHGGFSATGMTSDFTITASDPLEIVGVSYGYQLIRGVPEPATLGLFAAGLLGLARRRRRSA